MKNILAIIILLFLAISAIAEDKRTPSTNIKDPIRIIMLKEIVNGKEKGCYRFGEYGKITADVNSILRIDLDVSLAKTLDVYKIEVDGNVKGPLGVNPTAELSPIKLNWQSDNISGEYLLFNSLSRGLSTGNALEIEVKIEYNENQDSNTKERKEKMYVELDDFGLIHSELDTLIFVRSSQSRAYDTRPSASVMFGWKFRKKILPCRELSCLNKIGSECLQFCRNSWNFLSPMFGINVALLDFNKDENAEFGLGPVVALFGGGVVSGAGWNLSTSYRKNKYFFLGVSFGKIAEIIKAEIGRKKIVT